MIVPATPPVPEEALAYLRAKGYRLAWHYDEVWREEHTKAFMVAKAMTQDLLIDIRHGVDKALAQGKTFARFKAELEPMLAKRGWLGRALMPDGSVVELGTPRRLKLIYDTNLRTSRATGQWARITRNKAVLPYLRYGLGPSKEHRHQHTLWEGLILPVDHPFWDTHMPPNGFGCRCRVRQLTREEVERRGGPSDAPKVTQTEWTNKRTGETMMVTEGLDPGWDYNPGKARLAGVEKQAKEKDKAFTKAVGTPDKPAPPIKPVVPSALSTLKNITGEAIGRILEQVPGAEKRLAKVAEFTQAKDIKTLIIKQAEMGSRNRAASRIREQVLDYLDEDQRRYGHNNYTITNPSRTGGFTASVFNHVVVKGNSKVKLSDNKAKQVAEELKAAVKLAVDTRESGDAPGLWTIAAKVSPEAELVATWVHELGHQVHYWAGAERAEKVAKRFLSRYSQSGISRRDYYEYHAEHFCAWLFDRDSFAKFDPGAARYFDELIEKAIRGQERKRHD
ncbi:phage minor head protein [Veronia nyctiphanis]|uniref:phage minor head protein n=1 Tax=Veronia nyctiphanis TaxID=1278244 RepID=UPI00191C496B|nr:phage minor head protein [Veronia nyctiphanis]